MAGEWEDDGFWESASVVEIRLRDGAEMEIGSSNAVQALRIEIKRARARLDNHRKQILELGLGNELTGEEPFARAVDLVDTGGKVVPKPSQEPPGFLWPVLAALSPRDRVDEIAGDFEERFRIYSRERGSLSVQVWMWSQLARTVIELGWRTLERGVGIFKALKG